MLYSLSTPEVTAKLSILPDHVVSTFTDYAELLCQQRGRAPGKLWQDLDSTRKVHFRLLRLRSVRKSGPLELKVVDQGVSQQTLWTSEVTVISTEHIDNIPIAQFPNKRKRAI